MSPLFARTLPLGGAALVAAVLTVAATAAPTKPKALRPGDTIMIVAPAGELIEDRIRLAAQRLEEMGFRVIVPDDLFRRRGYLAGTDQQRADELMRAFTDPEVDAIFPGSGGYGVTRMLDLLDWDAIAANPKMVIGFSDITALHLAIAAKAGFGTFHSPNPQWGLGSDGGMPPFAAEHFWRVLLASENGGAAGVVYEQPDGLGPRVCLAGGQARGRMTGGNLSLLAALTGTPYAAQTDGAVLFLEDVREAPYRVDRMLRQLEQSGALDSPAAVVLGQFRGCDAGDDESSLTLHEVFADYFADAPYPVVANFPAGHVEQNATLPFGREFLVDGDTGRVELLETPVEVD
ncbi:LD-carboxypeptidase [Botrimarina sp.]|uniref:S66 peptidase family protein n=1 Tax=Botrimarina sp. TaxID=2795802 RepID=UPI0032EAD7E2